MRAQRIDRAAVHYRWPFMFRLVNNRQVEEERIKECVVRAAGGYSHSG